ncbi:MAG: hypothetical protein WCN98_03500 [Verrucomicrobiaceae bacterium]
MKNYFTKPIIISLVILLHFGTTLQPSAHGCSACGCSLNSDWESQGYSTEHGFKLDLNYMFMDQAQLRSGTRKISPGDVPVGQELEDYTRNNIVTLGLSYVFNADWGVSMQLPYIIRDHATFGEDHDEYDTSSTSSIGDIRLVARYQGFTASHHFGVQLGIKLPTGSFTRTFRSGAPLDRGLQPGTGTTDLIAGVYYFDELGKDWSWFAQATVQTAFNYRADYKPGTAENLDAGIRYSRFKRIIPQFQINTRISGRDVGAEADNFDSGGTVINLGPGVTVEVTDKIASFLFVQVPVYQNLNGYQLAPKWSLTAGIRASF